MVFYLYDSPNVYKIPFYNICYLEFYYSTLAYHRLRCHFLQ